MFSEDADIPIVMQRPILMVQRWCIEISQLQFVLGGRCPYCLVVQVVHIPVVAHIQLFMVQTLCQTIDIHQLLTRWSMSCCASREKSTGAVMEKTVELPRLHSFVDFVVWGSSSSR